MSSVQWTRLIRFTTTTTDSSSSEEILFGEPIGSTSSLKDIGALADAGNLEAKVIEVDASGPLSSSARVTDRVVKVGKLLGPLGMNDVTDIKCIGLNYKKHSEFSLKLVQSRGKKISFHRLTEQTLSILSQSKKPVVPSHPTPRSS